MCKKCANAPRIVSFTAPETLILRLSLRLADATTGTGPEKRKGTDVKFIIAAIKPFKLWGVIFPTLSDAYAHFLHKFGMLIKL